jgi:hypothetical protein
LTVESNAPPIVIALTGSGTLTQLSRDPRLLEFGWHDLDDRPAHQTSTIANTGTESATIDALALSGDSAHFRRLAGQPGDCAAQTRLGVGQTCRVRMWFDPTTTGRKTATLTVQSNAPAIIVDLVGTGTTTLPDTDGDGIPDDRDPDDDNDGVPDDREIAPTEPKRPDPPVRPFRPKPAQPQQWRLKRVGRVRVTSRRGVLRVATGYVATCPAGGPRCKGRLKLKLRRRSRRTGKPFWIYPAVKSRPTTIKAGTRRRIAFRLNREGRGLLVGLGSLRVELHGSVRTGKRRAVVRRAKLRVVQ